MNYFSTLTSIGIDLILFAKDSFEGLVTTFISPLEDVLLVFRDTEIGQYSILAIMFGAGIPLYVLFVVVKFLADLIT